MFDLSDRPLVLIPVKWAVLRPGRGKGATAVPQDITIKVEVELKDRDELVELFPEYLDGGWPIVEDEAPEETRARTLNLEVDRFMKLVQSWSGVVDNGSPVEISPEVVAAMMKRPGFSQAFDKAYFAACAGKLETRKGN